MVKSNVRDERTVSFPQRHRLLFSTSQPNSFPIIDSPEEPRELPQIQQHKQRQNYFNSLDFHLISFVPRTSPDCHSVSCSDLLLAPLYACGPSCSCVSWWSWVRMKRFQLWINRPSLALPVCSSESERISPRAEASGMVRNARRKLLA